MVIISVSLKRGDVVASSPLGLRAAGQDVLDPQGRYVYRDDLTELDSNVPGGGFTIPEGVSRITTPLRLNAWSSGPGVFRVHSQWYPAGVPYRLQVPRLLLSGSTAEHGVSRTTPAARAEIPGEGDGGRAGCGPIRSGCCGSY